MWLRMVDRYWAQHCLAAFGMCLMSGPEGSGWLSALPMLGCWTIVTGSVWNPSSGCGCCAREEWVGWLLLISIWGGPMTAGVGVVADVVWLLSTLTEIGNLCEPAHGLPLGPWLCTVPSLFLSWRTAKQTLHTPLFLLASWDKAQLCEWDMQASSDEKKNVWSGRDNRNAWQVKRCCYMAGCQAWRLGRRPTWYR
jgi:hypothetical protein